MMWNFSFHIFKNFSVIDTQKMESKLGRREFSRRQISVSKPKSLKQNENLQAFYDMVAFPQKTNALGSCQ